MPFSTSRTIKSWISSSTTRCLICSAEMEYRKSVLGSTMCLGAVDNLTPSTRESVKLRTQEWRGWRSAFAIVLFNNSTLGSHQWRHFGTRKFKLHWIRSWKMSFTTRMWLEMCTVNLVFLIYSETLATAVSIYWSLEKKTAGLSMLRHRTRIISLERDRLLG